jgi:small subunit ribosomal protein S7
MGERFAPAEFLIRRLPEAEKIRSRWPSSPLISSSARKALGDFNMPRRREVPKRETLPDPAFGSTLITKFINCMMIQGKKSVAEGAFYGSLDLVKDRAKDDPVKVFKKALENVKPILEVKSRRVGGATYQVPVEVSQDRRTSLAIRWLILNARSRSEKTMREKLASEFLDAANNRGGAIKKKEDTHRMAEANKAFAHYRW